MGDVCLLKYSSALGKHTFRLCRVVEVLPDEEGKNRMCRVSMRPRDAREKPRVYTSKTPLEMLVGVQRLAVILPVEEQGAGSPAQQESSRVQLQGAGVLPVLGKEVAIRRGGHSCVQADFFQPQ